MRISRNGPSLSHLFLADDLLLFGEALNQQMKVIMDYLDLFGLALGQRVNCQKSIVFFLANVDDETTHMICTKAGMSEVYSIGSYLGISMIKGMMSKHYFEGLLSKLDEHLASWKLNVLFFVGRVTLAKLVLSTLSNHLMRQFVFLNLFVMSLISESIDLFGKKDNRDSGYTW